MLLLLCMSQFGGLPHRWVSLAVIASAAVIMMVIVMCHMHGLPDTAGSKHVACIPAAYESLLVFAFERAKK